MILRTLSHPAQIQMDDEEFPPEVPAYVVDSQLDMKQLLTDFQTFWRENSEIWIEKYRYQEAAPHLILQAFLQRILNSGGTITREMASGTRRLDLCVHFQNHRYPIELKLRYSDKTYVEGQQQLLSYLDKLGCDEGWLLVFDRRTTITWEEKIFWKEETVRGKRVHVAGC